MRKDPDCPHTTHYPPVGYPRRDWEPWAPVARLTFLAGAGVKGVEGGGWDGRAAGWKEAGAGTEADPSNATGKLPAPLGWTRLA